MSKRVCQRGVAFTDMPTVLVAEAGKFLALSDLAKLPCLASQWRERQFSVTHLGLNLTGLDWKVHTQARFDAEVAAEVAGFRQLIGLAAHAVVTGLRQLIGVAALRTLVLRICGGQGFVSQRTWELTLQVGQWLIDNAPELCCLEFVVNGQEATRDLSSSYMPLSLFHHKGRRLDLSRSLIGTVKAPLHSICLIEHWPKKATHIETSGAPFCLIPLSALETLEQDAKDQKLVDDDEDDALSFLDATEAEQKRLAAVRTLVCDFTGMTTAENKNFWMRSLHFDTPQVETLMGETVDRLKWCKNLERCEMSLDLTMNFRATKKILQTLATVATSVPLHLRLKIRPFCLSYIHSCARALPLHSLALMGTLTSRRGMLNEYSYFDWHLDLSLLADRRTLSTLQLQLDLQSAPSMEVHRVFLAHAVPVQMRWLRHLAVTKTPMLFLLSLFGELPNLETLLVLHWNGDDDTEISLAEFQARAKTAGRETDEKNDDREEDVANETRRRTHSWILPKLTKAVLPSNAKYDGFIESLNVPLLDELWLIGEHLTSQAVMPRVKKAWVCIETDTVHIRQQPQRKNFAHAKETQGALQNLLVMNPNLPHVQAIANLRVSSANSSKRHARTVMGACLFADKDAFEQSLHQELCQSRLDPLFVEAMDLLND